MWRKGALERIGERLQHESDQSVRADHPPLTAALRGRDGLPLPPQSGEGLQHKNLISLSFLRGDGSKKSEN